MPHENVFLNKKNGGRLKLRAALLIMQILLPFGLYFALRWAWDVAAVIIAGVFFLSMIYLVWLG